MAIVSRIDTLSLGRHITLEWRSNDPKRFGDSGAGPLPSGIISPASGVLRSSLDDPSSRQELDDQDDKGDNEEEVDQVSTDSAEEPQ